MNERIENEICAVLNEEFQKQFNKMLSRLYSTKPSGNFTPEEVAPLRELSSRYYNLERLIRSWRADETRQWCQRVMAPEGFRGFVDWYLVQKAAAPQVLAIVNKYFY